MFLTKPYSPVQCRVHRIITSYYILAGNARMLTDWVFAHLPWLASCIHMRTHVVVERSGPFLGVPAVHGPSRPCALLFFMIKPFKFMPGVSRPSAPFGGVLSPSVTRHGRTATRSTGFMHTRVSMPYGLLAGSLLPLNAWLDFTGWFAFVA
jgi:hypothetical protein